VFLREGYAGYVTPCGFLVVVPITFFFSSARELEFLLFDGIQAVWSVGPLCTGWQVS
jgi:hypothetical protein